MVLFLMKKRLVTKGGHSMAQIERGSSDSFERILQITDVDLDFLLSDIFAQVLCEFYLNPRYLRGSDFLMRFSQGRWAEDIVARTINTTDDLRAVPYGPSSVAPSDPREMELYFERLNKAGAVGKQPDLLILPKDDYDPIFAQNWRGTKCPLVNLNN